MTQITVWQRLIDGEWQHNHIEDGWSDKTEPAPISALQQKSWQGAIWQKQCARLVNGKVEIAEDTPGGRGPNRRQKENEQ